MAVKWISSAWKSHLQTGFPQDHRVYADFRQKQYPPVVGTPTFHAVDREPNLVCYLPFDENTGTLARDVSGNGNHGTITGATWAQGKSGYALSFDAANEKVVLANEGQFDFERTSPFSIGMYIKLNSVSGTLQILYSKISADLNTGILFYIADTGKIGLQLNNTYTGGNHIVCASSSASLLTVSAWHHVVITYDGSSTAAGCLLYIDSTLKTLTAVVDNLSASILNNISPRLGNAIDTYFIDGLIDEPHINSRVLSAAEVYQLYDVYHLNTPGSHNMTGGYASYLCP